LAAIGLGVAAALVATAYATRSDAARSDGVATTARQIATLTTSDFRVVVRAKKAGNGGAPTAVVEVTTSQRVGGRWRATGTHRLKGPYFWNTVTGARALCRLEVRTAASAPRAVVQLLLTPSIGCGPATSYPLVGARAS
jgi:hypothetical protein